MPGTDTQPFDIRQCLGTGGFGEVYLARVQRGGATAEVALKVLHSGLDPRSQAIQRLKDEARLLMLIDHPNILRTFDLVQVDGRVALVSEYVEGLDLEDLLEPLCIPAPAGFQVLARIADALQAAYTTLGPQGEPIKLLHRDVKPGNIRIARSGNVKLLDFGIAKATGVTREAKTKTASVLGSFGYMAPERFDPKEEDTPAGDVCSLGCVMYELVSGGTMLLDNFDVRDMFRLALVEEKRNVVIDQRLGALSQPSAVIELLHDLLAYEAKDRPSLIEASARLDALAEQLPGPGLRSWCESFEWPSVPTTPGSLTGRTLMAQAMELVEDPVPDELVAPAMIPFDGTLAVHDDALSGPTFTPMEPEPEPEPLLTAPELIDPVSPTPVPAQLAPVAAPIDGAALGGFDGDYDDDLYPPPRRTGLWLLIAAVGVLVLGGLAGVGLVASAGLGWLVVLPGSDERIGVPDSVEPVPGHTDPVAPEPVALVPPSPEPGNAVVVTSDPVAPEPVVPAPLAPDPVVPDAVVDAQGIEPFDGPPIDRCGPLVGFEPSALLGQINPADRGCLDGLLHDTELRLVDRKKVGRVVINNGLVRCKDSGDCADYERSQAYFLDAVERSDPSMMLTYAGHLLGASNNDPGRLSGAQKWANRALEAKARWTDPVSYGRNVVRAHEVKGRAAYTLWTLDRSNESKRGNARDAATAWASYLIQLNKDPTVPLDLCESATGSRDVCDKRVGAEAVKEAIMFLSRPAGATVVVDGGASCPGAPCPVALTFGRHSVVMTLGDTTTTQSIEVGGGSPNRWMWTVQPAEGEAPWQPR